MRRAYGARRASEAIWAWQAARKRTEELGRLRPQRHRQGACVSRLISPPANRLFFRMAWMLQLPSTTCVTPKSIPTDIRDTALSSLTSRVVIRKWRILRKASRRTKSVEDLLEISDCTWGLRSVR